MRALVTYDAARFLPLDADLSPDERRLAGIGDEDSPHIIAWADPIESGRPAGEDERGIPLHRHPELLLADDPELWVIVDQWRCGVVREMSRTDYATASNWDVEAWLTMRAAHGREEKRQIEALRRGEE